MRVDLKTGLLLLLPVPLGVLVWNSEDLWRGVMGVTRCLEPSECHPSQRGVSTRWRWFGQTREQRVTFHLETHRLARKERLVDGVVVRSRWWDVTGQLCEESRGGGPQEEVNLGPNWWGADVLARSASQRELATWLPVSGEHDALTRRHPNASWSRNAAELSLTTGAEIAHAAAQGSDLVDVGVSPAHLKATAGRLLFDLSFSDRAFLDFELDFESAEKGVTPSVRALVFWNPDSCMAIGEQLQIVSKDASDRVPMLETPGLPQGRCRLKFLCDQGEVLLFVNGVPKVHSEVPGPFVGVVGLEWRDADIAIEYVRLAGDPDPRWIQETTDRINSQNHVGQ